MYTAFWEKVTVSSIEQRSSTINAVRTLVILAGAYVAWIFFPYITAPELASIIIPASDSMDTLSGQSAEASTVDGQSQAIKSRDNNMLIIFRFIL